MVKNFPTPSQCGLRCPAAALLPQGEAVLAESCHCASVGVSLGALEPHPSVVGSWWQPQDVGRGCGNRYCSSDGFMARGEAPIWVFNRIDHVWPCHLWGRITQHWQEVALKSLSYHDTSLLCSWVYFTKDFWEGKSKTAEFPSVKGCCFMVQQKMGWDISVGREAVGAGTCSVDKAAKANWQALIKTCSSEREHQGGKLVMSWKRGKLM